MTTAAPISLQYVWKWKGISSVATDKWSKYSNKLHLIYLLHLSSFDVVV